ncbi:MAG TPA: hypothetical protein PKD55_00420 [Bellilinea sp.]|nr:hypothetical protein [Bellilinea sp.]
MAWSLEERSKKLQKRIGWAGSDLEFQEFLSRFIEAIPNEELRDAMYRYYREPTDGQQESYFYQRTMQGNLAAEILISVVRSHPEILELIREVEERSYV